MPVIFVIGWFSADEFATLAARRKGFDKHSVEYRLYQLDVMEGWMERLSSRVLMGIGSSITAWVGLLVLVYVWRRRASFCCGV